MSERLVDHGARERFRTEWQRNFAVSANAGSGKTTAISERLATIALAPAGAEQLGKTAVVTYTKKAAAQIGQRARQVLLRRAAEAGSHDLAALDHLERAFFGTIHSFCLRLARAHGQTIGINLNPKVVAETDDALWEEFLESDAMEFDTLGSTELSAFLRHVPLEEIFPLARELTAAMAETLRARRPSGIPPAPADAACERLLAIAAKGSGARNVRLSQKRARFWRDRWKSGAEFLPLYEPEGTTGAMVESAHEWMAPLKRWLADAGAALAGELAGRYRAWRFDRGVQTYSDQIDAAMAIMKDEPLLDRIRREGWRVILDEAQDTDPQQFAVLIEIARPPGAGRGEWPAPGPGNGSAAGPRPGHFCMVGDGQQAIYGSRADIGNFSRYVDAFRRGDSGEMLEFQVTFRAPHKVIDVLNETLPTAFGAGQPYNFGLPVEFGALAPFLQVPYVPLEPGPENVRGAVWRFPLEIPAIAPDGVDAWLTEEARQIAVWLRESGPSNVGARSWGDIAVLAPRNEWLLTASKAFERAGLEVALQTRRNRCGDNPAYAWLTGLLAVCVDPENMFEWTGVLREIFGVSDGLIAEEIRRIGRLAWEEPAQHPEPIANALASVRPFVLRANDSGQALDSFAGELVSACVLEEKSWQLDPSGGIAGELERLLAQAAELGLTGGGPRTWLAELLHGIEEGRPEGKPTASAINFLTSYSAKGLEWPVVIVLGLWRGIGQAPARGLRLVRDSAGARVFFDAASLPDDTRESRTRERLRELTRLLYVTLTRARRVLILPWAGGFGGRQRERPSLVELWTPPDGIPAAKREFARDQTLGQPARDGGQLEWRFVAGGAQMAPLPARVLPHQLAHRPDFVREARYEAELATKPIAGDADEPIEYGLWWHQTMEFLPWEGDESLARAYGGAALAAAETLGFRLRAETEWAQFVASEAWRVIREPRWMRLAELGVFAPLRIDAWIDGVIDLVLHDPQTRELWVIDWKTNRRRQGEGDAELLRRLAADYAPQLRAYGASTAGFFPGATTRLLVYSTAAGMWHSVTPA